jgi:hypothetical protein
MRYPTSFCSISAVITTCLRPSLLTAIAAAIASLACVGQAISMDQGFSADETTVTREQELPLDAMGYLGGLFELASTNRTQRPTIRTTKFGTQLPCTAWTWQ